MLEKEGWSWDWDLAEPDQKKGGYKTGYDGDRDYGCSAGDIGIDDWIVTKPVQNTSVVDA